MTIFKLKYTEIQEQLWVLDVKAKSPEEAQQLFKESGEDPWQMVNDKKATWAWVNWPLNSTYIKTSW